MFRFSHKNHITILVDMHSWDYSEVKIIPVFLIPVNETITIFEF